MRPIGYDFTGYFSGYLYKCKKWMAAQFIYRSWYRVIKSRAGLRRYPGLAKRRRNAENNL